MLMSSVLAALLATAAGETPFVLDPRGGAHTVARYRFHEHFGVQVLVGRAINPITGTNWQGKGVQPDLAVPAETALETAQIAALERKLAAPR